MELEEAISNLKYELDKSKACKKYQGKPEELFEDLDDYIEAIEIVLKELEQEKEKTPENVRKQFEIYQNRICELEEKNKELEKYKTYYEEMEEVNKKFIAVDKIKEKIEEIKKKGDYRDIYNPTGRVHFMKEGTDYQLEVLKELLEEKTKGS